MNTVSTKARIASLLMVVSLLLSFNTRTVFSAGTATPTNTSTPTFTATPVSQGVLPSQASGGPGYVTISNLVPGMQYRIIVSGVVHYSPFILGDAQWNDFQMASGCFCNYLPAIYFNGVNLAAQNGQTVFDPNHVYTFLWLADTTQLQMYIGDSYYPDNSGSMNYQIFEHGFIGTATPSKIPTNTSTNTPTHTPTVTPKPTKTFTPSATATPTNTPTITPTFTFVPGTPHNGGNGMCWGSGASWTSYGKEYSIDVATIPSAWIPAIESAALTWTNVVPSGFSLSRNDSSLNFVDYGPISQSSICIAITLVYASQTTITKVTTTFDENDNFDVAFPTNVYYVQNVMTHEFGHWYMLNDIGPGLTACKDVTMWHGIATGEIKKTSLESSDIEGANWQYP